MRLTNVRIMTLNLERTTPVWMRTGEIGELLEVVLKRALFNRGRGSVHGLGLSVLLPFDRLRGIGAGLFLRD